MAITILFLIGLGAWCLAIADSELSNAIKRLLGVDRERSLLIGLSKPKKYFSMFPEWTKYTIVLPLIFLMLSAIAFTIRWIIRLLQCPYCIATYVGFFFGYFYLQQPIFESFLYAGILIAITKILDKITL